MFFHLFFNSYSKANNNNKALVYSKTNSLSSNFLANTTLSKRLNKQNMNNAFNACMKRINNASLFYLFL